MAKKYIQKGNIMPVIGMIYGAATGMAYIVLVYANGADKVNYGAKTLPEKISDALVTLSGSISDALCYILGISIQTPTLNYHHVIFMVIQVLQYYLLSILICHLTGQKAKKPVSDR